MVKSIRYQRLFVDWNSSSWWAAAPRGPPRKPSPSLEAGERRDETSVTSSGLRLSLGTWTETLVRVGVVRPGLLEEGVGASGSSAAVAATEAPRLLDDSANDDVMRRDYATFCVAFEPAVNRRACDNGRALAGAGCEAQCFHERLRSRAEDCGGCCAVAVTVTVVQGCALMERVDVLFTVWDLYLYENGR